jgi:hypothetical protein
MRTSTRIRPVLASVAAILALATTLGCATERFLLGAGGDVARIVVTPADEELTTGRTIQFTAQAFDSTDAPLEGVAFQWHSTNAAVASVNGEGLVTALAEGETDISVSVGEASAAAALRVVAPPPSECTGAAPWSCEPSGMTLLSDYGFTTLDGEWGYATAHQDGFARVVDDPTAPGSPQSVLEFVYPTGFTGGGYSPGTSHSPPFPGGVREIYWGFYWKANAEWQNHDSNINKLGYGWINGSTTFGLTWHWGLEFHKGMGLFAGGNYWHFNTPQAFPLEPGNWYRIEVLFRTSSTSGRADGALRIWVDGVLSADHPAIVTPAGNITDLYFSPTWGGLGTTPKAHTDYFRVDHVRLSTR